MGEELDEELPRAAGLVAGAGPGGLLALTGAGISTDAGIPDFRGPNGVWTRDPAAERLSNIESYLNDEAVRRQAWRGRARSPVFAANPTAGHASLVQLERAGILGRVVTQNTDGLHQLAGHGPGVVIEIHGNVHTTQCLSCGHLQATKDVLRRVAGGEDDPRCDRSAPLGPGRCGGILKPTTVSFGQSLDPLLLERARRAAIRASVLVAVGTTLEVQPAASLLPLARSQGAAIVIVNNAPTALDSLADVVLRGSISAVLPRLVPAAG